MLLGEATYMAPIVEEIIPAQRRRVAMTLWSIWTRRNDKLWSNITVNDSSVIHRADEFYQVWFDAKEMHGSSARDTTVSNTGRWSPPRLGFTKSNVDASFKHNWRRDVTDFMEPCLSVPEGEAWALAAATRFIAERGYQNVMFEVGSKSIVDKINRVQWIILSWITRSNNEGGNNTLKHHEFAILFLTRFSHSTSHI
uniref:RNase H type-1 domain-containing protein n=1 Tax=Glycine max TaxID=3847 RepID=I1NJ58_SOYBN